jgi:hypothetical protein
MTASTSSSKETEGLAPFHDDLAAEDVEPLNAGCAFVDGMNPGIPVQLFKGELAAVPVSSQTLHPLTDRKDPHLGGVGLGHGGEEVQKKLEPLPGLSLRDLCPGRILAALEDQGEGAFHDGTLKEKHALDVRMGEVR